MQAFKAFQDSLFHNWAVANAVTQQQLQTARDEALYDHYFFKLATPEHLEKAKNAMIRMADDVYKIK